MSDAGGGVTYDDDARGRLASLVRQIASASYNLAIAYDARDRRLSRYDYDSSGAASVSYPDGGHGRPVGLRLNGSYLVQGAADNAREKSTGLPRGNGPAATWAHDGIDQRVTKSPNRWDGRPYLV